MTRAATASTVHASNSLKNIEAGESWSAASDSALVTLELFFSFSCMAQASSYRGTRFLVLTFFTTLPNCQLKIGPRAGQAQEVRTRERLSAQRGVQSSGKQHFWAFQFLTQSPIPAVKRLVFSVSY